MVPSLLPEKNARCPTLHEASSDIRINEKKKKKLNGPMYCGTWGSRWVGWGGCVCDEVAVAMWLWTIVLDPRRNCWPSPYS